MSKLESSGVIHNTVAVTIHSSIPLMLFKALQDRNIDGYAILTNVGVSFEQLNNENKRISATAMEAFWRKAVSVSGDEALFVDFAQKCMLGSLYGLGFAWASSDTLRSALDRLVRYFRVICTAGEVKLDVNDNETCLWLKIPVAPEDVFPTSVDAALALFVQLCRLSYNQNFAPSRVELQRQPPNRQSKFNDFFQCPISYQRDENRLFFRTEELEKPLPMSNPRLARANDEVVRAYIAEFECSNMASRVLSQMVEMLPSGVPTLAAVANKFYITPRTLQRKLASEDTSFNELLDTMRQDLAKNYLQHSNRNIGEISYMLGFADPANFTRFFKRWVGVSPKEYNLSKQPQ